MEEIWKDCVHYEGLYEVSNLGRVRNRNTQHILAQSDNGHGYISVNLYKNGKGKKEYVHRLVAMAFIPNPDNLPCVNHLDEVKSNNEVSNLAWCDCKDNNNYGTHNERVRQTSLERGVYDEFSKRMKDSNPAHTHRETNAFVKQSIKVKCVETGDIFNSCIEASRYFGFSDYYVAHIKDTNRKALGKYSFQTIVL